MRVRKGGDGSGLGAEDPQQVWGWRMSQLDWHRRFIRGELGGRIKELNLTS